MRHSGTWGLLAERDAMVSSVLTGQDTCLETLLSFPFSIFISVGLSSHIEVRLKVASEVTAGRTKVLLLNIQDQPYTLPHL